MENIFKYLLQPEDLWAYLKDFDNFFETESIMLRKKANFFRIGQSKGVLAKLMSLFELQ